MTRSRNGEFVLRAYEVARIELPQLPARSGFRSAIRKRALQPGRYRMDALVHWRDAEYPTNLKRVIEIEPAGSP